MLQELRRGFVVMAIFTVVCGLAYPLAVTGVSQLLMPHQANGGLIVKDGTTIGAELIGQSFRDPKYFWSRPSAAGAGYDASSSGGSNLGPTSAKLISDVTRRAKEISAASEDRAVPIDLVTASASGLDPHISPLAAYIQVLRIAKARGLREEQVRAVVRDNVEQRTLGVFGQPRVNVLKLNLALDVLPRS